MTTFSDNTKGIPYGLADYVTLTRDNCYYVDKTRFIPLIEGAARFFFLIRPRRFGKSLWLSVLESYYDINNADRFEELFGERWIFQHPTSLRAKYMILRFNFSVVDIDPDKMQTSFESHCNERIITFTKKYEHYFHPAFSEELHSLSTITSKLEYINNRAGELGLRIYLIIDEYDNFTNSILATLGTEAYRNATHGEGFFRFFFNMLKQMTTASGAALERIFITGVSPITLDDVTSGFNIATNFTFDPQFNSIVGFSEKELHTMLCYYYERGKLNMEVDDVIEQIKPWYNNYCFAKECLGENMYNSDMVLYYLAYLLRLGFPPDEMIDTNIRTDYNKLRHLINIDRTLGENFSVIREVVEKGGTRALLNRSFSVDALTNPNNFKSLLFYFGLLTISGKEEGEIVLGIPNHTVREQMYQYMIEAYEHADVFSINFEQLRTLLGLMAYRGEWQPLFTFIATQLEEQSRIREFIDGEAHIKGFLLAYLGMNRYYQLLPEYELSKGYVDYFFQPNPQLTDMKFSYLLEVKYMKRDEPDSRIPALKEEAKAQLVKYSTDKFINSTLCQTELRLISVIFKGWEMVGMDEIK